MAAVNPQTFFRFAAEHHGLLQALYEKRGPVSEAELLSLIRKRVEEGSPSASYLVERMVELGFLEPSPEATAQFEMTRPFAQLFGHLLREYRLTSVEVIRAYFSALDGLPREMDEAGEAGNGDLLVRVAGEVADQVERMREDSRTNRDGVIRTVIRIKSNPEGLAVGHRYEVINRLWVRYIRPLRDMIDTEKAMDASLDRAEETHERAQRLFEGDGAVGGVLRPGHARIRRLRRSLQDDFHESLREVTPLYESLRRESTLARGASHALERISVAGLGRLGLPRRLGICNWQQQGLFGDLALQAYLLELRGYRPGPPPVIPAGVSPSTRAHVNLDGFDRSVRAALPIPDAFAWILEQYPEQGLGGVLRLYGRMHEGRYGPVGFENIPRTYTAGPARFSACRMQVRPAREGEAS